VRLLIGLGGNVGNVTTAILTAEHRLAGAGELVGSSRLYRTRPVGPDQPEYLNAAVVVSLSMALQDVLDLCQTMEVDAGRDRSSELRWGPRPLDVDLLMASGLIHRGPRLELPHPRLHQRAFALVPAAEVAGSWVHPFVGRSIAELAAEAVEADPDAIIGIEPRTPKP
jgi:2-amino-4-hydroxy-6-hydroxymethyldihydropteridine diphosphokinase